MQLTAILVLCLFASQAAEIDDAIAALQRRDFVGAERKLRAIAAAHPDDARALSLLATALDNQSLAGEAEPFHRRAVDLAPRSVEVLNNFAIHLSMTGKEAEARGIYRRIVDVEPGNFNANLLLAQLAIRDKHGEEALRYLAHVPENPPILLMQMNALYLTGKTDEGDALGPRLTGMARGNTPLMMAVAGAMKDARRFAQAKAAYQEALKGDPSNTEIQSALAELNRHE